MQSKTEWPKSAGIYKITCVSNGKIYIGKSINIDQRIKSHKYSEKNSGYHGRFQNAIKKYGWDSFDVEILKIIEDFDPLNDNDDLLMLESEYINVYNSTDPSVGYNMCEFSTDFTGRKHSEQSRENMRRAKIGTKLSEETKLKMSKAKLGKKVSLETKMKMSKAQREKNTDPETKKNRIRCRLGKKHSEESLDKMRKAKSRENISSEEYEKRRSSRLRENLSPETLEKMSRGQLGKKLSDEHKEKMRMAKLGKRLSEESKLQGRLTRARNKILKNQNNN